MSSVEPYFIKCLDEAGFKLPDVAKPNYGHLVVGEQCIEVQRYMGTPHVTLQVLAGLEGILYANTVNGTTDTHEFLKFFGKTSKTFLANRSLFFDMVTTSYLTTMQLITMKGDMLSDIGWINKELKLFIYQLIPRNLTLLSQGCTVASSKYKNRI